MGDHNSVLVAVGRCEKTDYPISKDGHLLDTKCDRTGELIQGWDRLGIELRCFTDPYCHLHYAFGSGDDFHCFDFEMINAGPRGDFIILDSTINSETGSFIMGGTYAVLPINTEKQKRYAVSFAQGIVDLAVQWVVESEIKPSRKGWNQEEGYFVRSVAESLFPYEFCGWPPSKEKFSQREFRFGGKKINKVTGSCMLTEGIFNDVIHASVN